MTITVTLPNGETADVEPSALSLPEGAQIVGPGETPHGFVREDYFKAETKRRSKDSGALRRELAEDPEFLRSVFESQGLTVGDDGKPQIPDVSKAVANAVAKFEAEKLAPEREARQKIEASLARTALREAAKGKVRDEFTASIAGGPSYVETLLGGRTKYDPELGYVVALDADGNPLPSSSGERPYADAAEFVDSFLSTDAGAMLRREEKGVKGPGFRGTNGGAGAKTITRADFNAMPQGDRGKFFADGGTVTD